MPSNENFDLHRCLPGSAPTPPTTSPVPPPLPCQGDDKWTHPEEFILADLREKRIARSKEPIQSHHKKSATALFENAVSLIKTKGEAQVGFLTLTCHPSTKPPEARKLFTQLWKRYLRHIFHSAVSVIDIDLQGRPHIHALVETSCDISARFNKAVYLKMRELSKLRNLTPEQRELRRQFGKALTTNQDLRSLWATLRPLVRRGGFAPRFELIPILETPEQVAGYLKEAYLRGVKGVAGRFKRCRLLTYSAGVARPWRPSFASVRGGELYRGQISAIAKFVGAEFADMKKLFGPKWSYRARLAIEEAGIFTSHPARWPEFRLRSAIEKHMPLRCPENSKENES